MTETSTAHSDESRLAPAGRGPMLLSLVALSMAFASLALLSPMFENEIEQGRPVGFVVILLMFAGAAYLVAVRQVLSHSLTARQCRAMILAGLCMRLMMMPSTPIQEDDYYRYLWDGAMVAHGWNPYEHAPQDVAAGENSVPTTVRQLAGQSGPVVHRINHPSLRTIYPPTAQSSFAVAYFIKPWSLIALRFVWLALEVVCLLLIFSLLRRLGMPSQRVAIWWLNPVLVKEVYNSGHMELTVAVCVLLALWLLLTARPVLAGGALGLAAAAKVWPVLLLPLMLRHMPGMGARMRSAGLFLAFSAVCAVPIIVAGLESDSGFTAYAQRWEMNDFGFMAFDAIGRLIGGPESGLGRVLVMITIAALVLWLIRKPAAHSRDLIRQSLVIIAATFLLSPTQMPWYYLWVLPLLPMAPVRGLLLLSMTLPLYYLRFAMASAGHTAWFDHGVVWLEHLPVWILIAWDLWRSRRDSADANQPNAARPPVQSITLDAAS